MDNQATLAFIGAGNLARALIAGLRFNQYRPEKIWAANPSPEKLTTLRQQFAIHTTTQNLQAVADADVVVLAVKPGHCPGLCAEIRDVIWQRQPVVISVAVGVTIELLQQWLGGYSMVVRAMPNTPAMVGAGVTGLYASGQVLAEQKELAEMIFRVVGMTLWVDNESDIDLVCAVSGCGPGYIFLIMEMLASAAQQRGLPESVSRLLTAQTFLGAARLALESDLPLTDLRRQVASLKGTTEAAIQAFEQGGLRQLIDSALDAALHRALEISHELGGDGK